MAMKILEFFEQNQCVSQNQCVLGLNKIITVSHSEIASDRPRFQNNKKLKILSGVLDIAHAHNTGVYCMVVG